MTQPRSAAGARTRERVLDAALQIVAGEGLQALTHRGVEARAGVTHGLTTYYFSDRQSLIGALLEHICDRQVEWITAMYAALAAEAARDPEGVDRASFTTRAVEMMLSERTLTLARYELYLHAARHPPLRALVERLRQRHVDIQAEVFRAMGAPDPQLSAHRLLSAMEGFLLYQLSAPQDDVQRWATPYLMLLFDALATLDVPR